MELHTVLEAPKDIRDLREATACNTVGRLKALELGCKQITSKSTHTYYTLTKNLEFQALESQLQEAKQHAYMLQVQLKALSPVKRMKRLPEKCTAQQYIHMIKSKVIEVSK
jgi:hypothetical protein